MPKQSLSQHAPLPAAQIVYWQPAIVFTDLIAYDPPPAFCELN